MVQVRGSSWRQSYTAALSKSCMRSPARAPSERYVGQAPPFLPPFVPHLCRPWWVPAVRGGGICEIRCGLSVDESESWAPPLPGIELKCGQPSHLFVVLVPQKADNKQAEP